MRPSSPNSVLAKEVSLSTRSSSDVEEQREKNTPNSEEALPLEAKNPNRRRGQKVGREM